MIHTYNNEVADLKFVTSDSQELHKIRSKIHKNVLAAGAPPQTPLGSSSAITAIKGANCAPPDSIMGSAPGPRWLSRQQ